MRETNISFLKWANEDSSSLGPKFTLYKKDLVQILFLENSSCYWRWRPFENLVDGYTLFFNHHRRTLLTYHLWHSAKNIYLLVFIPSASFLPVTFRQQTREIKDWKDQLKLKIISCWSRVDYKKEDDTNNSGCLNTQQGPEAVIIKLIYKWI